MRHFINAALAAALLTAQAAGALDLPDFDQGVHTKPFPVETRSPSSAADMLWVTMDPSEAATVRAAGRLPQAPTGSDEQKGLYRVSEDELPGMAAFMHETFNRCGGFFTYRTKAEAEAGLAPVAVKRGGPYSIDQKAFVTPLVAQVQEGSIRATIESMSAYHTRYYTSDTGVDAARWLQGRWQALAAKIPGASTQLVAHKGWKQPSVVLTIPGVEKPDEIVVLGGHLDSIVQGGGRSPGADDNASGIAVLTEAVRVLGTSGLRPRRTIQFMGYSAEEVGLRGSQDLAKQAASQGKKVIAVIQYDMTNFNGSGERIFLLNDFVDKDLTAFLGMLIEAYAGVPWSTTQCGYACSDHASWTRSGFPASAAFEASFNGMNRALHTERDTLATTGGTAQHSVAFAKLAVAFAIEMAKTSAP